MTFQASAHSMATVGMLAPFIESLFVSIFNGLKHRHHPISEATRRQRTSDQFWNPQYVFRSGGPTHDLVAGIEQLADTCDLTRHLPTDYLRAISALFAYRNNMFHNGFEWPDCAGRIRLENCPEKENRCNSTISCKRSVVQKFINRIGNKGWPEDWFERVERNEKPWLIYMTPSFCAQCIDLIDDIIVCTGRYLKDIDTP